MCWHLLYEVGAHCFMKTVLIALWGWCSFLALMLCVDEFVWRKLLFLDKEMHQWKYILTWNGGGGETCWRSSCLEPLILNLGTRWKWVVNIKPRPSYPGTHWIGGFVSPRAGLDDLKNRRLRQPQSWSRRFKKKVSLASCQDWNPGLSSR
jgi:hypothetical protein